MNKSETIYIDCLCLVGLRRKSRLEILCTLPPLLTYWEEMIKHNNDTYRYLPPINVNDPLFHP